MVESLGIAARDGPRRSSRSGTPTRCGRRGSSSCPTSGSSTTAGGGRPRAELEGIRRATRAAEAGMAAIAALLARSEPADGGRVVDGEPLTCELLRAAAVEAFAASRLPRGRPDRRARRAGGGRPPRRARGRVANDDHLVCDLFPYDLESACFSDMTRTFAVGTPDPEIATWHEHTREALELSRELVRPGANGAELYRAVCRLYEGLGYPTSLSKPEGDGAPRGLQPRARPRRRARRPRGPVPSARSGTSSSSAT